MNEPRRQPSPAPDDSGRHGFESLLIAHQKRLYYFIRSMVFNPDDARDVLQDVNAIILRKRERFTPGSDFKSWAFAIARFEGLSYLRRIQRDRGEPADTALQEQLAQAAEGRSEEIDGWLAALELCREKLASEDRELLHFRYGTRRQLEDIALDRQTTEGALKQKLFRIRNQLKTCILNRLAGGQSGEAE